MSKINKPRLAGQLLDVLYHSVRNARKIKNIPDAIKQLINEDIWREVYIEEYEKIVTYERFEDFLVTLPPEGLGTTIEFLKSLIGNDTETLNLLDEALQRGPGKTWDSRTVDNNTDNNIINKRVVGTSRQAGLRRLRSEINKAETPERAKQLLAIQQAVFNQEMSIHRALIKIGARRETFTVPVDPEMAGNVIKKRFNTEQIKQLTDILLRYCNDNR